MIDRMSGRVSLLLVSAALVLVLLLGWFVLVAPQRSKASKLDSQIGDANVELQAVTSLLDGPVGRQSLAVLKISKTAVPDDPRVSQILRQFSAAASTAGIELTSITPQALIAAAGAEELPISLAVQGHYFAIQSFLRILRRETFLQGGKVVAKGRLYTVDSIQFTGGASDSTGATTNSTGLVSATLTVNAFVYSPTSVAPVTAPAGDTTSSSTTTP